MKRYAVSFAFAMFLISVIAADAAILLDKVVAIVNKEVVTWSDLYKAMEFEATDALKRMPDKERREYFKQNEARHLEALIEQRLQLQEAARLGFGAREEEINSTIQSIRDKYKLSQQDFEANIRKEGFTIQDYRKKLAEQITIGRLVDAEVRSKIVVSESDIKNFLAAHPEFSMGNEGYSISHIYLSPKQSQQEIDEKLKSIYADLGSGMPFPFAARKYSEDSSAQSGGELGFVKKDHLSREFLEVIEKMRDGEISQPFVSETGVHIVRLNETRLFKSEAEFRELVRQKVIEDRFAREYKNWRRGLRERAYVDIIME
ncbi:MAG TPA: peptidylprolyl isomerase [Dissulfurispiraceae bacterium]|nr:peptidylprolyl isomerase [Dissulfurispiraceae bacterium]